MRKSLLDKSTKYKMNDISIQQLNSFLVPSKEGPDEINLNVIFDYRIIVSNIGSSKSTTTTITDTIPSGLEIISASPKDKVTINGQVVTYVSDGIDIADEVVIIIKVKSITPGIISNKVIVAASNNENPITEVQKSTNILDKPPQGAYLQIMKQAPDVVYDQQSFEYTIELVNSGDQTSLNTVIEDIIPNGLIIDSVMITEGTYTRIGQKIEVNIGNLEPSKKVTVIIKVSNPVAGQILLNVAQVNSNNNTNPINQSSTQNTVLPKEQNTTLQINKTSDKQYANIGDIITYTIQVQNTGTNPSTKTTIEDNLPDEVEYIEANSSEGVITTTGKTLKVEIDSIEPLQTVNIKIITRAIKNGIADNRTSVFAQNNTNPNNSSSVKVNIGEQPVLTSFLEISKKGSTKVNVGEEFEYIINVKNLGNVESTKAIITDNIPSELQIISITTDKGIVKQDGQKIIVEIDKIYTTDNININIKVKATQIGNITNIALVEASNNSNPVKQDSIQTQIDIQPQDSSFLDIEKEGKESVKVQDEFIYLIVVKNVGQAKSTIANIIDSVPNELEIISIETTKGTAAHLGQNVDISIPEIDVNEVIEVRIKVRATKVGDIVNTAQILCANNTNPKIHASKSTNITNDTKKAYTTGPLKKKCYDNRLKISIKNTRVDEFNISFTAQNLNDPNDKKDYNISIQSESSACISICDLPEEYKITFNNIEEGVHVLIRSCCNCYTAQIIRQKDLIPEELLL